MKRIISLILITVFLISSANAVDLYVDTDKIETDTPPTTVDGRTLVPLRAIFEAIGATVEWNNETRTATGTKGDTTVSIQINNTTAYVNTEPRTLDVPAQIINGRTMVPARFISESMGCDVTWYQKTQTAAVANTMKGQKFYVTETGSTYHYNETCNGGTYREAALAEAVGRGLTPCDKCVLSSDTGNTTEVDELLFAKEHIRIYYTGYIQTSDTYTLNLRIENDSDHTISGYIPYNNLVGGQHIPMKLSIKTEPGRTSDGTISFSRADLQTAGAKPFRRVTLYFEIFDVNENPRQFSISAGPIYIELDSITLEP